MLYLTKIATALITPLGLMLCLGLAGLGLSAAGRRRAGTALALLALAGLWIASMPVTARWSLGLLERQYPIFAATEAPAADAAIVLGGAVSPAIPPRHEPDLGDASDRVLFAAELYRAGKVRRIVITGGNLPWMPAAEPEALTIRRLLIGWGVPADAIVAAGASRTTAENAREVAALWPSLGLSSALLVTSAAHMPRAISTFRMAGLPVSPAPVDIHALDEPAVLLDFMPDAGALSDTSAAVREAIGYLVYRTEGEL